MQSSKKLRPDRTVIQWDKCMVYIIFAAVFLAFAVALRDDGFLSPNNMMNVLRQTAMISVMSVAATFVMASGEIDLSVGSNAAMTAMFVSLTLQKTDSILLALVVAVSFGLALGLVNGMLVTKLHLSAFLATMGTMQILRGSAMWITNTAAVPIRNSLFNTAFGIGSVSGIPVLVVWTVLAYVIGIVLFNKTAFGRHTLATGGNKVSAGYSGINTNRVKIICFMMSGLFAAFAGIMYAARMQAGRFSFGDGDEMSVIAAVVLGGTSMTGGTGSVVGALFGSLLMGLINNALILAGLSTAQQTIVKGAIIVVAVALSNLAQRERH